MNLIRVSSMSKHGVLFSGSFCSIPVRLFSIVSISCVASLVLSSSAFAQKENSCERELRDSTKVVLRARIGEATGRVCLDDGDSFGVGLSWVRIRGIDAPEIGRGCLQHFDRLPSRCETSKGAIQALLVLSELLQQGAVCESDKKGHLNRWPVDCTLQDGRNLALEMTRRGFACATNSASAEIKAADLESRKQKVGLWSDEWAPVTKNFPSRACNHVTQRLKSHLRYLERKARRNVGTE